MVSETQVISQQMKWRQQAMRHVCLVFWGVREGGQRGGGVYGKQEEVPKGTIYYVCFKVKGGFKPWHKMKVDAKLRRLHHWDLIKHFLIRV